MKTLLAAGLVAALAVVTPAHAEPVAIATLQAEAMALPTGAAVVADATASGGRAVRFAKNGAATASVTLPAPATALRFRLRGVSCKGAWSQLALAVDGATVWSGASASTAWRTVTVTRSLRTGTHTVKASLTNANACGRDLFLDVVEFTGDAAPPTVTLTADAATVPVGTDATLRWSSTGATSCAASGGWSGARAGTGTAAVGPVNEATTYALACTGPGGTATSQATVTPRAGRLYWGGWLTEEVEGTRVEAPWDMRAATAFEASAGKSVSLIQWSSPFHGAACGTASGYCWFQTPNFETVRRHGAIPVFAWANNPGTGDFTNAAIAAGKQDAYLTAWAQAAKAWGHPFFLRFAWEMNGSWFPWGVGARSTAAEHVAMWRHVHDVFTAVGATNATWVWCPNIDPYGVHAPLETLYPGDAYVDWTCLDGYNRNSPWTSFADLFGSTYREIVRDIAPTKPMMLGEVASTEAGGDKPKWISEMLAALPAQFPRIAAVAWYNKVTPSPEGYTDWPIESSVATTQAFSAAVAAPSFAPAEFADLPPMAPVQALP